MPKPVAPPLAATPGTTLVATLALWLGVAAMIGGCALARRRRRLLSAAPQYVPPAALVCGLALTICSTVLSPQFLVWTLPLAAAALVAVATVWRRPGFVESAEAATA